MAIGTGLALLGGAVASSAIGAKSQKSAAAAASSSQEAATMMAIDEQRRQFDAMRELLDPFVDAGSQSLAGQLDLIGLGGEDAQRQAISALEQGPQMQAMIEQGENAILQNASATGGLRGGNTQGALAQFRPQILSDLINQQYSQLGGLTQMGQASAAGVGSAGMNMANQIGQQFGQMGAAQAGAHLARGQANANLASGFGNVIGQIGGMSQDGIFGKGVF